ncbi:cyclin G [Drosophila guanche]|uniref:Blast:Cyclin-G2 n=1 Tax=Drosophila guanche TaxID=7266 RepID=A0A3B0JDQ3_DROGU|nr:cyclin G [Drosophila guanche]XP_034128087.1 cyclin G [Drosophila guanche]XP_034128088.1 cyclin G [Drosophila guanche]SPP80514.1 blast:Cyclin-G2 [Drosophila guanche]
MSVPVRYSAAAEYAADVVDCGLEDSQYQYQQQQQQLDHQQQPPTNHYEQEYQYQYQSQYQQEQDIEYYCQLEAVERQRQQQQLMQQRTSMSSSVMSGFALPPTSSNNNMDANSINAILVDDEQPSTSAQAAAASVLAGSVSAASGLASVGGKLGNVMDHNAEMPTDWMRIADEGRYGTPGAAGLEYQKYDQQQQQEQQKLDMEAEAGAVGGVGNEPTSAKKQLEDQLHALTSDELYETLKEYDVLQDKYHTVLLLPKESRREVTAGGRDGSAYVLRCLKMWYELPSDVLFSAMSLVDRFLDRMAVKPKHMACMSVASFHLAIKQLDLKPIPAEDLVTISQCGCTAGDLERMAGVIANKLGVQMGHAPITSVSYLRIYYALFRNLAKEIGGDFFKFFQQLIKLEELENRLEILLCDVKTTVITPSTLALVLICLHLDFHIKESYTRGSPELKHVFEYILFLQQYMRIPDRVFTCGFSIVSGILSHYNGQNKAPYKQRLVWKLSSRTLRVLRPINRFSSDLPTIEEGISNALDDGLRSRTESISSEEEEDWPTSPIIPIFEQC